MKAILGQKLGMSQTFVQGKKVPITKVLAGPCVVTQVKDLETDGYWAVQLGFGTKRIKNLTKPMQGHLKGATQENRAPKFLAEIRLTQKPDFQVGDQIKVADLFSKGDLVKITGTSKGKGFAGVVKRWQFAGGPRTHGQSDRPRSPGSIGQGTDPGRIWKGKKMAGRMGGKRIEVRGLEIIDLDPEKNELLVAGSVPGPRGSRLIIQRTKAGSEVKKEETEKAEKTEEEKEKKEEKESKKQEEKKTEEKQE